MDMCDAINALSEHSQFYGECWHYDILTNRPYYVNRVSDRSVALG